jgi:hypothetical protein
MIYEFRTYTLRPGTLPEFLKRFGDALPKRERFSKLAAFWYTDTGPQNQVIHVWPYQDALERSRLRAEAVKDGSWPPDTGKFIVEMKAEIFDPMPFSPPLLQSSNGPFFEMRICRLKPFTVPIMAERWKQHLAARTRPLPVIGVFASDVGDLNQWMYIWPHRSLDERAAAGNTAIEELIWSSPEDTPVLKQESKMLRAAPFSPIK